ncbi:MAG: PhnD/SsuA/transferrin family substrate-binding protein [Magnetococcus sp. WYHC-3]
MARNPAPLLLASLLILSGLSWWSPRLWAGEPLILGVFAYRPPAILQAQYQPLADYLSDQLGDTRVILRVLDIGEIETELAHDRLDLLFTNPSHYIRLRTENHLSGALATLISLENGISSAHLGGVIIARDENHSIRQLSDLAFRNIAVPGIKFLGGYQAQALELLHAGVRLPEDAHMILAGSHDKVVAMVLEGTADAGFIRSSVLEQMTREGRISPGQLRVVNLQSHPGFPYQVSTRLYPEWPFVALPRVDQRQVRRIAAALLSLDEQHPAAQAAHIAGFAPPADYLPVETLARTLRVPPFDIPETITLRGIWNQQRPTVLSLLASLGVILVLVLKLSRRNAQLVNSLRSLAASEERHRSYLEHAPVGVFVADNTGKICDFSPSACTLTGYPRESLLGMALHHLGIPEDVAQSLRQLGQPRQPRTLQVETTLRGQDDQLRHVSLRAIHLPQGQVMSFCTDITERKQSETRRRLLDYALDQVEEAAFMVNIQARFEYVNAGAARHLGYSVDELLHMGVDDIDPHFPAAQWQHHWHEVRTQGSVTLETTHRHCSGREFPVEVNANHLEFDGQDYILALVRDISRRKEFESRLQDARRHAEELARAKSEFLANMSHEIRTPINAVLGFARIGLRDHGGKTRETFQRIHDAGLHLLGVVNEILDYSKIEAGKMQVAPAPFCLKQVVDHVGDMLSQGARHKGLAFVTALPEDLSPWVWGDGRYLQQILTNLLANAVKFTASGEVRLCLAREGQDIWFRICDTGIGMSADVQNRLFEPFEQADGTSTRMFGGTGLGLVICRNLAGLMGGEIQVDSAPGRGSAFTLRLPLPETSAPDHVDVSPRSVRSPSGRALEGVRVLAAEDMEANRLVLDDMLLEAGATCVMVASGQEAVDQVQSHPEGFDVVLMDVQMPGMDGHAATRRIRALVPDLAVIGLTARALPEERAKCLECGMVEHLSKPIDPETLTTAILRCLARSDGQQNDEPSPLPLPCEEQKSVSQGPALPAIDWAALEARYPGRTDFIMRLARTVLAEQGNMAAQLRLAVQQGEMESLARHAHSLKGMAGILAAGPLRPLTRQVEEAARAHRPEAISLSATLAAALDDVLDELRRFIHAQGG